MFAKIGIAVPCQLPKDVWLVRAVVNRRSESSTEFMKRTPSKTQNPLFRARALVMAATFFWTIPALPAEIDPAWLATIRAKTEQSRLKLQQSFEAMAARTEALRAEWPLRILSLPLSNLQQASPLRGESGYACGLWLGIGRPANGEMPLTLHNTVPGRTYRILSTEDLTTTRWTTEKTVIGTGGHDATDTTVPMNGRAILFFQVAEDFGTSGPASYSAECSFKGLDILDSLYVPPDTMGAIGPNHFVELLNGGAASPASVAVYNKRTGERVETAIPRDFFAVDVGGTLYEPEPMIDPRILYDHQTQRWVACATDPSDNIILAVSANSSPVPLLSNWTKHRIEVARPDSFSDYVTLGLDKNGIYLAVYHPYSTIRHTVVAIKKPEIYSGILQTSSRIQLLLT